MRICSDTIHYRQGLHIASSSSFLCSCHADFVVLSSCSKEHGELHYKTHRRDQCGNLRFPPVSNRFNSRSTVSNADGSPRDPVLAKFRSDYLGVGMWVSPNTGIDVEDL